ncbi:PAS domain-containing protein [Pseudorhizobium tarimense]|uniref:PAS domain-containing protein n=1 Tax=Pseudorhizobium tarimense TaxID=1079109 RepID=A0ABV2H6B1_9HYPH
MPAATNGIAKAWREIWIQASYNPIFRGGKPYKVLKLAADITEAKKRATEDAGKLEAISRSLAVIELTPTGEIIAANENFCRAMGYTLNDIIGKYYRIDRAVQDKGASDGAGGATVAGGLTGPTPLRKLRG